ncbi:MAG: nuclease-related domain-containing protein [Sporichthyaceae bacterium]
MEVPLGAGSTPLGAIGMPGTDLATNPPGALAEAWARGMRAGVPVRSRAQRLLHLDTDEAYLRSVALAERRVATMLDRLGPSWHVLHAVPIGGDRPAISHLVIGPGGVFTLTSRAVRRLRQQNPLERIDAQVSGDDIRVQGDSLPYVAQARAQAWRSARALSLASGLRVFARPAVVIVGVDEVRFYSVPDRVEVLARRHVVRWLRGFPAELDTDEVLALHEVARRGETWARPAQAPEATQRDPDLT